MLLVGLLLQAEAQTEKDHNFEVAKNLEIFNAIYRNLDMMYVDSLKADHVIGTAIDAMFRQLDPYTEYYPEEKTSDLKTLRTGKYSGIGSLIRYHMKRGNAVIDEPYEGTPSADVGLRKGDVIQGHTLRERPSVGRCRHDVHAEVPAPVDGEGDADEDHPSHYPDAVAALLWDAGLDDG